MADWKGKTRGSLLGFRIFVWLLRNFGLKGAYSLLYLVVPYFVPFAPAGTKTLFELYHRRLGMGFWTSIANIFRNYFALGKSLIDRVAIKSGFGEKFTYVHEYTSNIDALIAEGKGGFLLSAHLGNWDIAGYFMQKGRSKVNIVMYDEEHQKIKQYLEDSSNGQSLNIIPIKDDFSHIIAIKNALSNGEIITMHADRFRELNRTVTMNFLEREALFPQGPFLLAAKFKAPVSFVFCVRESEFHYHLFASEGKVYESVEAVAEAYRLSLEEKVKRYPLHWNNYYDFWKL